MASTKLLGRFGMPEPKEMSGPKKFERFVRTKLGMPVDNEHDDSSWQAGGRYTLLENMTLHAKPDPASDAVGKLKKGQVAMVLATTVVPMKDGSGEVSLAYLADTSRASWTAGWGQVDGGLALRRLRGSWEAGGRYRVLGAPVLREGCELESEHVCEVRSGEEVLVLELALMLRNDEPRLRARVRTDEGHIGWLTIELPGGSPLLETFNLFSKAAVHRGGVVRERRRSDGRRLTPGGAREGCDEAWEVHGLYRLCSAVVIRQAPELESEVVGDLRKGQLVHVHEARQVIRPKARGVSRCTTRLRITAEGPARSLDGWISCTNSRGDLLIDARDQLEYDKVMRELGLSMPEPPDTASFAQACQPMIPSDTAGHLERNAEPPDNCQAVASPTAEFVGPDVSTPRPDEALEKCDGDWRYEEDVHVIRGGEVLWSDGSPSSPVTRLQSPGAISVEDRNGRGAHTARLTSGGLHLQWSDGTKWTRKVDSETTPDQKQKESTHDRRLFGVPSPEKVSLISMAKLQGVNLARFDLSPADDRQVNDASLETEGPEGLCVCRDGILGCGAMMRPMKPMPVLMPISPGSAGSRGLVEPAPEPATTR